MSNSTRTFSLEEAHKIGEAIGIDWAQSPFDAGQFRMGLDVELEQRSARSRNGRDAR